MNLASTLFVCGLTFDIIGAFFLAQSFIAKNLEDLTYEGTSGYGSPPNLRYIRSNLYQKAEAQIGFSLLAIGFSLQSIDYFFLSPEQTHILSLPAVFLCIVALAVVVLILSRFIRSKLYTMYAYRMAKILIPANKPKRERNEPWIINVGEYLIPLITRASGETSCSFADRILATIGIPCN